MAKVNGDGDGEEVEPPPDPAPSPPAPDIDPSELKGLSSLLRGKSDRLRRTASQNIFAIVATVLLMTLGVLALPPLINVVEDKILGAFGYETSQIDTRQETNTQAVEVQVRNRNLVQIIDRRDRILRDLQSLSSNRRVAFAPEIVALPNGTSRIHVLDYAVNGSAEIAVGEVDRDDGSRGPFAAIRTDDTWRVLLGEANEVEGSIQAVDSMPGGFILVGRFGGEARIWRVNATTGEFSADRIRLNGNPAGEASAVAFNPEKEITAVAQTFSGQTRSQIEATQLAFTINDPVLSEWWSIPPQSDRRVVDLLWHERRLLALTQTPTGSALLTINQIEPGTVSAPVETNLPLTDDVALGFGHRPDGSLAIITVDVGNGLVFLAGNAQWSSYGDRVDMTSRTSRYDPTTYRALSDGSAAFGGSEDGTIRFFDVAVGVETSLNFFAGPSIFDASFRIFEGADDRMILHPVRQSSVDGRFGNHLVYSETQPFAVNVLSDEEAMLELIGYEDEALAITSEVSGSIGANTGSDQTASSSGIAADASYLRSQLKAYLAPRDEGWIIDDDLSSLIDSLEFIAQDWAIEWQARETAATTLALLRQGEEASDLWRNISSISARLAVIALLVYLVNILVNLYRYNMRLAAFYQARADAIDILLATGHSLGDEAAQVIADLAKANTPEDVTFGSRPATPTDKILDTATEIVKAAKGQAL